MLKKVLLFGLVVLTTACYGVGSKLVFSDPAKPIIVNRNHPMVVLRVKANPTTGYKWVLDKYSAQLLIPVKQRYFRAKQQLVGAGGYEEWTFRVRPEGFTVPHLLTVDLAYMRPWSLKSVTIKKFTVLTIDE